MKRIAASMSGVVALVTMVSLQFVPSTAMATLSIGIDFEGDTIGQPPVTDVTPGDPMTQPSAIGGYNPNYESPPTTAGSVVVGTPSGGSKQAVLTTDLNNPNVGAIWMDVNGFDLFAQQIRLSFDVNVLAAPTSATAQPKNLGSGTAGILLGMNTFVTSDQNTGSVPSFRFAVAPTSETGGIFAIRTEDNSTLIPFDDFTYFEGVQYSVSIVADYDTGKLDAFVNGVEKLSDFSFWSSGQTNVSTNEFFFHLNGEGSPAFSSSIALDNISATTAVPEPGAILYGGLVCGAIGVAAGIKRLKNKLLA